MKEVEEEMKFTKISFMVKQIRPKKFSQANHS
jgi:hypothetical protein